MSLMDRRRFLSLTGAVGVAGAWGRSARALPGGLWLPAVEDFDFIFLTDSHIQPELNAAKGCEMAFKKMSTVKADFAIQGGDHIFDGLEVPTARSLSLFELYDKTQQDLGLQVYHTLGNHDCLGVFKDSGVRPSDPLYGKKYFADHVGKLYYSFDHKGVHFVVLDSIGITGDRKYEGRVDAGQLAWLAADLNALPAGMPIIVSVHIPLVSAVASYEEDLQRPGKHNWITVTNAAEVIRLFAGRNVLGVLQGHWHINERVEWHGVPYLTCGAVCGNWWHGTRMGTPEGFTVASVREGKLSVRYETYGFRSAEPRDT